MWRTCGLPNLICKTSTAINPRWCTNVNCAVWVRIDQGVLRNVHGQEHVTTRLLFRLSKCQQDRVPPTLLDLILVCR